MDVILHVGAHRCATTTFQNYLRLNTARLTADGTGYWGPRRTRDGLFRGILPVAGPATGPATGRDPQRRAAGRVRLNLARSEAAGVGRLVVTDENMIGTMRENLRIGELYCGVGERMARYAQAFDGRITDVVLNVRSPDVYWASVIGYGVTRGRPVPSRAMRERLASGLRSWRDVAGDIACAVPGARIRVAPFETYAGRPEALLAAMTGRPAPRSHARNWLNATPRLPELRAWLGAGAARQLPDGDGRWQPLSPEQCAALRETYADDLMWLAAGGDGLARLIDDPDKNRPGYSPAHEDLTRGRRYDEDRRMAGTG